MSDAAEFLLELGAGVYEQKLNIAIAETALSVMQHAKTGEITLKFKISPISTSQVRITHSIDTKSPTLNGQKIEKNTTDSIMYVYQKGKMSIFPENQMPMFGKQGQVVTNN